MIVLTGGGTGGHLAIAATVKEALNAYGIKPVFIGSTGGQDRAWFGKDEGFKLRFFLPSRGVMNQKGLGRVRAGLELFRLALLCRKLLKRHRVKAVLSVGGYSAAPAALAAVSLGIGLFIHEQNAVPGTLNRLLRPFAKGYSSAFEPDSLCPDYPVKPHFFERARIRSRVKTVLFLGGSQGATAINAFARSVAKQLADRQIAVIHQTGKNDLKATQAFYKEAGIEADCFDFDPNLIDRIAKADFAVARAGAGTLFELAANNLPALYVPYPFAASDHQRANARFLSDRGLSWQCDQDALGWEVLAPLIDSDLSEPSGKLAGLIKQGGAACLARRLMEHQAKQR